MDTNQESLLQGIDTVIVRVSDIARSKEWFVRKLGLSMAWEDEEMKLIVLDTNSAVSLTLWQTDEPIHLNKMTASYPIFRTSDAEALRAKLVGNGVTADEIVVDAHVKYFQFFDPDGNVMEACEVGTGDE